MDSTFIALVLQFLDKPALDKARPYVVKTKSVVAKVISSKLKSALKPKKDIIIIPPLVVDDIYNKAGGSLLNERWKYVTEFHNYAVSNFGRIKTNLPDGIIKLIPLHKQCNNYPIVRLRCGDKIKHRTRHRLVAEAFVEIPQEKLDLQQKLIVNHIDENKNNPNMGNLEWLTNGENYRYTVIMEQKRKEEQRQKEIDDFLDATTDNIMRNAGLQ